MHGKECRDDNLDNDRMQFIRVFCQWRRSPRPPGRTSGRYGHALYSPAPRGARRLQMGSTGGDVDTLTPFPLVLKRSVWNQIASQAERLTQEQSPQRKRFRVGRNCSSSWVCPRPCVVALLSAPGHMEDHQVIAFLASPPFLGHSSHEQDCFERLRKASGGQRKTGRRLAIRGQEQ